MLEAGHNPGHAKKGGGKGPAVGVLSKRPPARTPKLKNKRRIIKMATKKELTTAAKELNKVLGLDPAA